MPVLRKPYLLYLGEAQIQTDAKTAAGLRDWCRDDVVGEWSLPTAKISVGVPRLSPAEAGAQGAGSLVIGVAPVGGQLPATWLPDLEAAIDAGLDIVSGMHTRLTTFPSLVAKAAARGVALHDVRHSNEPLPAGTGRKRSGMRVATVGTDCALGKKYSALALTRALQARGAKATFRATGQTGIMIAGEGIAIDAVVADFIAGAAEVLSPDNAPDHWDVIEGQGALFHPAYAGVTLGLLHGSQPDFLVLCHDPTRKTIEYRPDFPIPPLAEAVAQYLTAARITNRQVRLAGVSINSSSLDDAAWARYQAEVSAELGVSDRKLNRGNPSIWCDHRPREHRPMGGGVPSAALARLVGRENGGSSGGGDAGGDRSDAPVGLTPTPQVPTWRRGGGAVLRGRSGRRRTDVANATPLGSWGPASMGGSAARRGPHERRRSGGA